MHLSYGDDSAVSYAWQLTCDLAVHGWDLATAIGTYPAIDDELATTVYTWVEPLVYQWRFSDADPWHLVIDNGS